MADEAPTPEGLSEEESLVDAHVAIPVDAAVAANVLSADTDATQDVDIDQSA